MHAKFRRICRSILLILFSTPIFCRPHIRDFARRYTSKHAFVLGNGPSLNSVDWSAVRSSNAKVFGTNNIFLNYDAMGFRPHFYVVEDADFAQERASASEEFHGYEARFVDSQLRKYFKDDNETVWLNVGRDFPASVSEMPDEWPPFSKNASRIAYSSGSTLFICLQLAFYMGFSRVTLLGVDHRFFIPAGASLQGYTYDSDGPDLNHFYETYPGRPRRQTLPVLDFLEAGFRRAAQEFNVTGRSLLNATPKTKLWTVDRVEFDALFPDKYFDDPSRPVFSVVVTTHHPKLELLRAVLESVVKQQRVPRGLFELLVVDNAGAEGNTAVKALVERLIERTRKQHKGEGPSVSYHVEPVLGLSHARNRGVELARGKFVAFIDDDAHVERLWLKHYVDMFREHPEAAMAGGPVRPAFDSPRPEWLTDEMLDEHFSMLDYGNETKRVYQRVLGCNMVFRRSVFDESGKFGQLLGRKGFLLVGREETDFQEKAMRDGFALFYCHNAVVHHHLAADRLQLDFVDQKKRTNELAKSIRRIAKRAGAWSQLAAALLELLSVRPASPDAAVLRGGYQLAEALRMQDYECRDLNCTNLHKFFEYVGWIDEDLMHKHVVESGRPVEETKTLCAPQLALPLGTTSASVTDADSMQQAQYEQALRQIDELHAVRATRRDELRLLEQQWHTRQQALGDVEYFTWTYVSFAVVIFLFFRVLWTRGRYNTH